jgi:hypothetical protein
MQSKGWIFKSMRSMRILLLFLAAIVGSAALLAQQPQHLFFRVTLGPQFNAPVSGRALIFLSPYSEAKAIDVNWFKPTAVYVAAGEVSVLNPGGSVDIDADALAFPEGFSSLKPGDYQAQAVLDVAHTYAYSGRTPGDLISAVVPLKAFTPGKSATPNIILTSLVPERPAPPSLPEGFDRDSHEEDFVSPALSAFFGRPIHMRYDPVPHRLLDPRLHQQPDQCKILRGNDLSAHDAGQTAAHDLGHARRVLCHGYSRVCRLGQQRALGQGTYHRIHPLP